MRPEYARNFAPPRPGGGAFPGRVCAAVLTYNRKDLLVDCIEALLAQSERPEAILVVDNGSTDGTSDMLATRGYLANGSVRHYRLEKNVGAASGFTTLFRLVWQEGFEWGWYMDDDVVAAPDALAELKRAFAHHFVTPEEVGFLISNAVTPDGKPNCVPSVDDRLFDGDCARWPDYLSSGLVRIRISAMNSILVPRTTVTQFGAPSLDFGVWGEDTDWSLRVTERLPAFLVGQSRVVHVRSASGELNVLTESDPERLERFYFLYRNTVYLRRRFWPRRAVGMFLAKAAGHFGLCLAKRRLRAAALVLQGTLAGLFFQPRYLSIDTSVKEF